jgi:hypothetical protein
MSPSVYVANEVTMSCEYGSIFLALKILSNLPINVRKSKIVTAGPMRGNIRANVDANMIARMQTAVAKEGLYVRGYTAVHFDQTYLTLVKGKSLTAEPLPRGDGLTFSAKNPPKADGLE